MFTPDGVTLPGELLLITDELLAPADFLLHRYLNSHLKDSQDSPVVLVSISEDIGRWKAIAGKLNINLASHLELGRVVLVDVMSHVPIGPDVQGHPTLRDLYSNIRAVLDTFSEGPAKKALIIVDDLSSIEWIGVSTDEIARFARALRGLCRKHDSSLVLRHHITTPGEPDELFKRLFQLCNFHMDVFPLSSGRSGSVSGQVALQCGPATDDSVHPLITRSSAIHYRLVDSGSTFFDRGTGNGVL
ncbi:hypothetical protein C8Q74DRAFT_1199522 [Fomes fomentarius]|nr:hypothetical protein C8Q74DRAFT_1199522 [Fomes fomentarius]